jgi:hypothetical protein
LLEYQITLVLRVQQVQQGLKAYRELQESLMLQVQLVLRVLLVHKALSIYAYN